MGNSQTKNINKLESSIKTKQNDADSLREHLINLKETVRRGNELIETLKQEYQTRRFRNLINIIDNFQIFINIYLNKNSNDSDFEYSIEQTRRRFLDEAYNIPDLPDRIQFNIMRKELLPIIEKHYKNVSNYVFNNNILNNLEINIRELEDKVNMKRIQIVLGHDNKGASSLNKNITDSLLRKYMLESYLKYNGGQTKKNKKYKKKIQKIQKKIQKIQKNTKKYKKIQK